MKGNSLLSLMVTDLLRKKISLETHANAHNFRDLYITKKVLSVPIEIILFQSRKVTSKKDHLKVRLLYCTCLLYYLRQLQYKSFGPIVSEDVGASLKAVYAY